MNYLKKIKKISFTLTTKSRVYTDMVVHIFTPSTQEAEAERISVSLRLLWFPQSIPGQPGLCSETLSQKKKLNIYR